MRTSSPAMHKATRTCVGKTRWCLAILVGLFVSSTTSAQESNAGPAKPTTGTPPSSSDWITELREKAEKGDAKAQSTLGLCYAKGEGVPKDEGEAVKWYRKAAEQGYALAQNALGNCYEFGPGVTKDSAEAVKWYRKAVDQGFANAQVNLGFCYAKGEGVPKDEAEAVKWYRRAADQGFANAQFRLGYCYDHGEGVPKDEAEAVKWYRKAADQGFANAQYNLGICYGTGDGVPKDDTEAVKWFRKAADQGNADAACNLGVCYQNGKGVTKDVAEAVKWFRKAADRGNAWGQVDLGVCYAKGEGVPKDEGEAVKWYRMAADQGFAGAQLHLGVCYQFGEGVPKDSGEAVKWYRKAAEQGYAAAQDNLGVCYANGQGVPKNLVEAYRWFNLAAAQGEESATNARDLVERMMTPEQIAEGQRLAREFKPKKASADQTGGTGATEGAPDASGTGFFITADGYLITNQHVVADARKVAVLCTSGRRPARVVYADAANDLALLKAEGTFAPLPLVPSGGVKLAATVFTVGFPNPDLQGFQPKFARGDIAGLAGAGDDPRFFQISVPVQPGNSGGPLVDERGNVVGVVTAKLSAAAAVKTSGALPENVNYALKGVFVSTLLDTLSASKFTLAEPHTKAQPVEETAKAVEASVALVLVWK